MRQGSYCRSYRFRRRGNSRPLRCEPLEHRRLLSITVDTLVDEADGNIDDGDVSLRDAIAAAAPGETINFDASLDGGTILLTLGELAVGRSMTIDAAALPAGLTIDASGNDPTPDEGNGDGSRIFLIDDGEPGTDSPVTISGLTLTGGDVDAGSDGGAVHSQETLAVTSTTISRNSSPGGLGGGIYTSGDVTVANSRISGNSMGPFWGFGGGIYAGGDVTVTSSIVSENHAGEGYGGGGGIYTRGNVTIIQSTISGNSAVGNWGEAIPSGDGGAVHAHGEVTVSQSTISGNLADGVVGHGGGVYARADLTITESTISGNSATGYLHGAGGGIFARGHVTITESTVSGNMASDLGGGEGGGIVTGDNVTLTIANSIVAGNTAIWHAPDILPGTGQVTVSFSVIGDSTGTSLAEAPVGMPDSNGNLIGDPDGMGIIDPRLAPLADNGGPTETHALLVGSPAIDAGDPSFAPPPDFDQRGNPRVADGDADGMPGIDMGAFEVLRGDASGDGEVNGLDVDPFVDVLLNGPPSATADMNADGSVNGLDVDPFVAEVVGGTVPPGDLNADSAVHRLDAGPSVPVVVDGDAPAGMTQLSATQRGLPVGNAERDGIVAGSTVRQLHRRRPIHNSNHGDDPAHAIHRRTVRHAPARRSRTEIHVGEDGQRSPPGTLAHDVQPEAVDSWHGLVDRAMRDDTNWDRFR